MRHFNPSPHLQPPKNTCIENPTESKFYRVLPVVIGRLAP